MLIDNISKKQITIKIGELHAASDPTIIYTLLGSCVAVCLYDRKNRLGGMNHIFLPGNCEGSSCTRYGDNAMEHLIKQISKLGGDRKYYQAKAFGGAHVIPSISREIGVGSKIVDYVIGYMKKERIEIIAHDFGGTKSRKVYFHTDTGKVFVKRIMHRGAEAAQPGRKQK